MAKKTIVIEDWMIEREKLTGNVLICYAYLWQETDGGKEPYVKGYQPIAERMGVTTPSVYNALKALRDKGLVRYDEAKYIKVVQF